MKAPPIQKWWPLGQSLDLVASDVATTAGAIRAEVGRFTQGEPLEESWVKLTGLDELFGSARLFTNVPTLFFAIPTASRWTVLWNNSFLCDGYDSLCHCLSMNHGLTTLHWSAHDDQTTFQPGSSFTYRFVEGGDLRTRSVWCAREDSRWIFGQVGEPLPEEDTSIYDARRKSERLNESVLMTFLDRCGARPWDERFYDFATLCFRLHRTAYPTTVIERAPRELALGLCGASA